MISTYLFGQTFYTQFGEKKEIVGSKTITIWENVIW